MTPPRADGRRPAYPYDRGLTEEDVRRIARAEARALLVSVEARNVYPPRSIPLRTVDRVPVVTALPDGPVDGDEVYFDTGEGFLWHFIYVAGQSGAYRWAAVAAQTPLVDEEQTDCSVTATSYGAPASGTAGPSLTVPLPGDYLVSFGMGTLNDTALQLVLAAPTRGSAAASDADAVRHGESVANQETVGARTVRFTGLAAGDSVTVEYRVTGGTGTARNRWLNIAPIRVGRA